MHAAHPTLFVRLLIVVTLGLGLFPATAAAQTARRNIVVLIADDLGLDCGCYGNTQIKTPNIDSLAANGTCFTHAFATVASCSPSRAVLLTGLHTHTSGQYGLAHAAHNQHTLTAVKSLPAQLRGAGYRTGIIGKLHVQPQSVYSFDLEDAKGLDGNRNVAEMARRARQFIADSGDKPFLLVMGYSDPHRDFGNQKTYKGVPEIKYDPKDVVLPYFLPDQPEVREELAQYYQSVSRLDHGVGLMLKTLKETGRADDTLVLFLSDNGIPFPGAKTTLYDSGLHLPLIVSSPAQKKRGHKNAAMASFVDVMPTLLDWAGVKAAVPLPGRSLLPILDEEKPKGWDVVYGSHQCHEITMYYPMRMVRTRDHKYILNLAHGLEFPFASDLYESTTWQGILKRGDKSLGQRSLEAFLRRPREELYDVAKDPNELKNIANDPDSTKVLADLRTRLKAWQKETRDPWLVKYTHE
ncbi:MAG: sulfatase [Gemmataceae bacterium]|nr:sulfatase [Gemmataceae bacterium]